VTGRDRANANAVLEDLAAYNLDEAVYSPFGRRIDRLPGRGKVRRYGAAAYPRMSAIGKSRNYQQLQKAATMPVPATGGSANIVPVGAHAVRQRPD